MIDGGAKRKSEREKKEVRGRREGEGDQIQDYRLHITKRRDFPAVMHSGSSQVIDLVFVKTINK